MTVFFVLLLAILTVLIILFEWQQINEGYRKEKIALIVISCLGWGLIVFLLFFPETPGPSEWIDLLIGMFRQ
mgnify:CR=1 FL=1